MALHRRGSMPMERERICPSPALPAPLIDRCFGCLRLSCGFAAWYFGLAKGAVRSTNSFSLLLPKHRNCLRCAPAMPVWLRKFFQAATSGLRFPLATSFTPHAAGDKWAALPGPLHLLPPDLSFTAQRRRRLIFLFSGRNTDTPGHAVATERRRRNRNTETPPHASTLPPSLLGRMCR